MQGFNMDMMMPPVSKEKVRGFLPDNFAQHQMYLNSMNPPESPYYFRDIEGFYYGWKNPEAAVERFGWSLKDFKFTLEPNKDFKKLMDGIFIPQYGDMVYKRQVHKTKRGTLIDPVNLYFEQLTYYAYSRQAFL